MSKKPNYQRIPTQIELFGRVIDTQDDTERLSIKNVYGEARYGANQIALNHKMKGGVDVAPDELKTTYLHEMLHFILNFTSYEEKIVNGERIDLEQFIELMAAGIYQYEKSAQY